MIFLAGEEGDKMAEEAFKRKLAAIMSADVKGYSRLMGDNETETVKTLTAYRKIIAELIHQHRGRVVDSPGDNILAEFASVVDAVQCAVALQKELQARNAELSENRRMQFRIGINLGDVIEEESRLYGDGINIAARLEALADPGGICISKTAFDQIETKLPLGYEYLGEKNVKNIARPVGAYRVLLEPRVTVVETEEKKCSSGEHRLPSIIIPITIIVIAVLLTGAFAVWYFALRPVPPSRDDTDHKKIESQLLVQLEEQKRATEQAQRAAEEAKREAALQLQKQEAEQTLRRAQEERIRVDQERKMLQTETQAIETGKRQAEEEGARREQEKAGSIEPERKKLDNEKRIAESAKHDGIYSGQLCNQIPSKEPFCWPVALVVRNGIAEGSWIGNTQKTATVCGTVSADGSVQLKLATWTKTGSPVEATMTGRIVNHGITASGQWRGGFAVSGEWRRVPMTAAAEQPPKAGQAVTASHDGTYSGQLCNQIPNREPFCWPISLVVKNGIAEGSWIGSTQKTATAHGTVFDDGSVKLQLAAWSKTGSPVDATMTGKIINGIITASGAWSSGFAVSGEWKRSP